MIKQQILINLIVNARDAIYEHKTNQDKKTITIETTITYLDDTFSADHLGTIKGKKILLSVSDTGIGMSRETLDKIFEPFFTTKGLGKGTGLGLATVYGIVKQNSANIYATSEPGKGTAFKIYWPQIESGNDFNQKNHEEKNIRTGQEKILFVEDDDSVREFGSSALKDLGYTVYPVDDAGKAVNYFNGKNSKVDLLITDLVMPGMSGRELANQIQKINSDLPVIYVSGYTDNDIVHEGELDEGIHFLQKPYSIKDLSIKIREVLDEV